MAPLQRTKSATKTDQLQIQHFIHQHPLHKIYMTSEFNCDGCNIIGHGIRYRCSACDFDIHEQCATSPHRISSHHHPHHQLILVNRPRDSHLCHVCKSVTNGISYTCESHICEFNIHILCIQIPPALGGNNQPVFGGYNGEHAMVNQQQQGIPMTGFGGNHGVNNNQPVMVNHNHHHHHQQQQQQHMLGVPMTAFDGYHGVNTNQTQMINHHHPQQQGMHLALFNTNQQLMASHQQQQGIGIPATAVGGYDVVNHNQTMMISHPPPPPTPGTPLPESKKSSGYAKVGKVVKIAGNIATTSLIGVPLFNLLEVAKQFKDAGRL